MMPETQVAREAPMAGKEIKRGRLRRTSIEHLYDEDGAPSGHIVSAEHEPGSDGDGKGYNPYPPDLKTPHETYDGAEAKMREHHETNVARFGKKKKANLDIGPAKAALGR